MPQKKSYILNPNSYIIPPSPLPNSAFCLSPLTPHPSLLPVRTILFHIPTEIGGIPFLGFGILLAIWIAICSPASVGLHSTAAGLASLTGELPMMLILAAVIAFVLPALADESGLTHSRLRRNGLPRRHLRRRPGHLPCAA